MDAYAEGLQFKAIKVYEAGRDSAGLPFFAMEYIHGEDLGRVMKAVTAITP